MNEDNRFLYYVDENGQRRDDAIHEPFLNDPQRQTMFQLLVIRDHVEEGNSLDDAVALFGTDFIRQAHREGQLPEMLASL